MKRNRRRRKYNRRKQKQRNFIIDVFALLIILFLSMILLTTSVTYFNLVLKFLISFLFYFTGFSGCIFLIYWFFTRMGR